MKTIPSTRGISYVITCAEACTVTAADGSILHQHEAGQLQSQFTAIDDSVTLSLDAAIIVPVFSGAAGGLSSPSGAKSMSALLLTSDSTLELKGKVMYRYVLSTHSDSISWQDLSMESHPDKVMTCEICIDAIGYRAQHEVIWPPSWIWLDGQSVPDLSTGGLRYFSVRSDQALTFIAEHTCYIAEQ